MNKDQLAAQIAAELDMSKGQVRSVLESFCRLVTEAMVRDESVRLVGFGEFLVRQRKARKGRNPNTGQPLQLPETRTPAFVPGKQLIDAVKER